MDANRVILGLDIGGTNFRMGLVDEQLNAHRVQVTSSRTLFAEADSLLGLAQRIGDYLAQTPKQLYPAMVCAGLPAVLDRSRRYVYSATNFPGMEGRDVVAFLEDKLNLPVAIEHDAYYLLAYDMMRLGLPNEGTITGCYFGTGLGNAMYINGKPYIGKNGAACELGHLPVPFGDRPCNCGNMGCIEMYSCGKALERIGKEHFSAEGIGSLFEKHADSQNLQDFVRYMAAAVASQINIMDPDHVVLGGGLVHMPGFPKQALRDAVLAYTRKPYPAENLSLHFAQDAPESGIIGAAIAGFEYLKGSKA